MEPPYVLIKGGMFYAHNSAGYVSRVEMAELYTKEYAEGHAASCSGEVVARLATDFLTDTDHIDSLIERLNTMRKALLQKERDAMPKPPEIECCKTRKCGWQGMWSDLVRVKNEKESARLGMEISDNVCPKCGCKEVYRVEQEGA